MEERQEVTLNDGRVFETCSFDEWKNLGSDDCFAAPGGTYFCVKKFRPRTCEGVVTVCIYGNANVYAVLTTGLPLDTKVIVTEVEP